MIPSRRCHRRDAGVVTEVLVFPVLLMFVMLVFQFALYAHADHIASAAAEDGSARVRLEGGTIAEGRAVARQLLDDEAPTLLSNKAVDVTVSGNEVRVEVTGRVSQLVPFLNLAVRAVDEGPIERFVPEPER